MAREFGVVTGFIASLLDSLADAPPDWRVADTRFETLQRLATTREQLASGIVLTAAMSAAMVDEQRATSHPIGFSSGQN